MINLTKPDETATIDLSKGSSDIVVRAQWVDNGDGDDGNDDLDLRCSILHPGDKMYLVDGEYRGSLQEPPFAHHHGDVQSASVDMPGEEVITVARDIAKRAGGPVALCFSVYSALNNGAVSVASLRPQMKMSCGNDEVVCSFDFNQGPGANNPNIYTYVIGYAIVTEDEVILAPSGKTSKPGQEETPWIFWKNDSIDIDIVGPAVFKGAQTKHSEKYNKQANISYRFVNVPATPKKKGLLGGLFG
ncbi:MULTISPECIES: hypothetical protein [Modicisalibacter]|uniref:hypothetical protein n=1 Tax=Modicisalibacter TaxID=574347 RepID=UPI00100C26CC|nr:MULTISPECIES: hypothetical protein [Halomonadaceae]MBZ9559125.1 hypothetical protein [Modicisalibacter sp. R2A 31.J]MBZ9576710.1 hypothetical protein [Modicisalibacter sp. MOD 31.J]